MRPIQVEVCDGAQYGSDTLASLAAAKHNLILLGAASKSINQTIIGSFFWVIHRWNCTDSFSPGCFPSFKLTVNFTSPAFPAVIPKIIISWAWPNLYADLITACKLQLILLLQQQMDFMIYDAGRDFSSSLLRFHSRTRRKVFDQRESAVRCLILVCFSDSASKFRLFFIVPLST